MGNEVSEDRTPWVRYRSVPVCAACWERRNPDRQAARLLPERDGTDAEECMVCESPTVSGIYVRMRVEWR